MSKITYISKRFNPDHRAIIDLADTICRQYAAQGYDLTLRQLYYQFVSRDAFPNSEKSYKKLGSIINDARLAGEIDWSQLTDRGREVSVAGFNDDLSRIFRNVEYGVSYDPWADQGVWVEVWVEKQALEQVVARAANARGVSYLACKGYMSQSEMHEAGMRMLDKIREGRKVHVIHLGDHDPSGIDMTRDIRDRLTMFIGHHVDEVGATYESALDRPASMPNVPHDMGQLTENVEELYDCPADGHDALTVNRIALNMNQVRQYNPPPNFAKITDSRAGDYIARYGSSSWELDALDPDTLNGLITAAIDGSITNTEAYNAAIERTRTTRRAIRAWIGENIPNLTNIIGG